VLCHSIDSLGQHGDLHIRRTIIALVRPELRDKFLFAFFGNGHEKKNSHLLATTAPGIPWLALILTMERQMLSAFSKNATAILGGAGLESRPALIWQSVYNSDVGRSFMLTAVFMAEDLSKNKCLAPRSNSDVICKTALRLNCKADGRMVRRECSKDRKLADSEIFYGLERLRPLNGAAAALTKCGCRMTKRITLTPK